MIYTIGTKYHIDGFLPEVVFVLTEIQTNCFALCRFDEPGSFAAKPICGISRNQISDDVMLRLSGGKGLRICEPKAAKQTILEEANALIYGDREADYGSVTENFTNIAKGWEVIFKTGITPEQVGLAMAWVKIARETNRPKRDNLVDLAGYAGCIGKIKDGQ